MSVGRQVLSRQIYIARPDALEVYSRLLKILDREGKSFNTWVYEQMVEYVKRHGEGNPCFRLDQWVEAPEIRAFPTLGEAPVLQKLLDYKPDMLYELLENARAYVYVATAAIQLRRKHETHLVRVADCPLCSGERPCPR
ncbi:MAG: hypothetical protein QXU87_04065 [Candidatus Caldarchaeum sp.]